MASSHTGEKEFVDIPKRPHCLHAYVQTQSTFLCKLEIRTLLLPAEKIVANQARRKK